jgi:DNA-directed RNA polymerase specialized sigma24 family protein
MSVIETAPPARVGYTTLEALQQLREAIHHLPPEELAVFLLRQNGELTYEQIAQRYNRSVATVKDQMRSALLKLRWVAQGCPAEKGLGAPRVSRPVEESPENHCRREAL